MCLVQNTAIPDLRGFDSYKNFSSTPFLINTYLIYSLVKTKKLQRGLYKITDREHNVNTQAAEMKGRPITILTYLLNP